MSTIATVALAASLIIPMETSAAAPSLKFPWDAANNPWVLTQGPHDYVGDSNSGLDFARAEGNQPVLSMFAGIVTFADLGDPFYCEPLDAEVQNPIVRVLAEDGSGWEVEYLHFQEISVADGQRVAQGQVLGTSGSAGCSTGDHVHVELLVAGKNTSWIGQTIDGWKVPDCDDDRANCERETLTSTNVTAEPPPPDEEEPAPGAQPPLADLLRNGSWEECCFASWDVFPNAEPERDTGVGAPALEGDGYGVALAPSKETTSFAQDIPVVPAPGESYLFSLWVRSAERRRVEGVLALWTLGGPEEKGDASFEAGRKWKLVTAPLDVDEGGHTGLRAEVYLDTPGVEYYFDGAAVVNAGLGAASWECCLDEWKTRGGAEHTTRRGTAALDGRAFGVAVAAERGAQVMQVVEGAPSAGRAYRFSIWVRSSGREDVRGTVRLSALGGRAAETGQTKFRAGRKWELVSAPLDVRGAGHDALRAEVILSTPGVEYFFDRASLGDAGLENASWERCCFASWDAFPNGRIDHIARNGAAVEGTAYGVAYVRESAGRSFAQDVPVAPAEGRTYRFSVWIRADGPGEARGRVALWALGGDKESAATTFIAGRQWKIATVALHLTRPGHTSIRAEVYLDTPGIDYQFDRASLNPGAFVIAPRDRAL